MSKVSTIQGLREALGLTRTQFGRSVGVCYLAVYEWEKLRHKPSVKTSKRIFELARKHKIDHSFEFETFVGGR